MAISALRQSDADAGKDYERGVANPDGTPKRGSYRPVHPS